MIVGRYEFLSAKQVIWVQFLCWKNSHGGGHGNPLHYSCLENPCGQRSLQSMVSQRVGRDWATKHMSVFSLGCSNRPHRAVRWHVLKTSSLKRQVRCFLILEEQLVDGPWAGKVVQERARKPNGWLQAHREGGEEMIVGQKWDNTQPTVGCLYFI